MVGDEDQLRPAGGEALAAAAAAGLDHHRPSLRRARHGEGAARVEEPAAVVEAVDLVAVAEAAGGLVHDQRIVFPGVPVAEHHLDEFVGAVVAGVMRHHLGMAHVRRLAVVQRGDDVPGAAALAHQVQRLEGAGDVEGLEIGGGRRAAEAEAPGRRRHHGQHHHGVELHAADTVLDGVVVVAAIAVGHREPVVEEAEVEFPGLQHPADLLVVVGREEIGAAFRMPPGAGEVGAVLRLEEADEVHLPHGR